MYSNNPQYKLEFTHEDKRIFTPVNITDGYSTQRYIEASNQQIYSQSGATSDILEEVMGIIVEKCNQEKNLTTLRTDIGALANSILYRLKYPVDQHCIVRMGAILSFMEDGEYSEPKDVIETVWLQKKIELAFSSDAAYRFFLTWGIANTQIYKSHLDILNDSEYFIKRTQALQSLLSHINLSKKG